MFLEFYIYFVSSVWNFLVVGKVVLQYIKQVLMRF